MDQICEEIHEGGNEGSPKSASLPNNKLKESKLYLQEKRKNESIRFPKTIYFKSKMKAGPAFDHGKNTLNYHQEQYNQAKMRIDKSLEDVDEIDRIKEYLVNNRLAGFKYNYSLNEEVQNFTSYHMFIEFDESGEYINIINRIPVERIKYIKTTDPEKIKEKRKTEYNLLAQLEMEKKNYTKEQQDNDPDFKSSKSSCSCHIDQIKGIQFGGTNSRFWMLRKHFNSMSQSEIKKIPFYSWQCITLQLYHRDVDLIITEEKQMEYFIRYIIYKLKSIDGQRDSASDIIKTINEADEDRENFKQQDKDQIYRDQIDKRNQHQLFKNVYLKYLVMKARAKISFIAFEKRQTIMELFCLTILKCYNKLLRYELIESPSEQQKLLDQRIEEELNYSQFRGILIEIVLFNQLAQSDKDILKFIQKCKEKKIENQKNLVKLEEAAKISQLIDKTRCIDLFRNLQQVQDEMSNNKDEPEVQKKISHTQFIKIKLERFSRQVILQKHNFAIALSGLNGIILLKAILKKIQIVRELFLFDIEEGSQVFIPYQLSQDHYPYSMRYYDSIIGYIQENMKENKRQLFDLKNSVALAIHKHSDLKTQVLESLGIIDNGKQKKLSFKHAAVNKKKSSEVNHHQSAHSIALQRSKYICIDDNLSKQNIMKTMQQQVTGNKDNQAADIDEYFDFQEHLLDLQHKHKDEKQKIINKTNDHLALRYCNAQEVSDKRQQLLNAKTQFLIGATHLRSLGQKNETLQKIENWIDSPGNLDKLFNDKKLRDNILSEDQKISNVELLIKLKNQDFKKKRFRTLLINFIEQKLIERRSNIRQKQKNEVKEFLIDNKFKLDYQGKNKYVESNVEEIMKFFNVKNKEEKDNALEMHKIKVQAKQIQEKLQRKIDEKKQKDQDKIKL